MTKPELTPWSNLCCWWVVTGDDMRSTLSPSYDELKVNNSEYWQAQTLGLHKLLKSGIAHNVGCSRKELLFYDPSQYQFGSDVTSASFAFNWSRGRGATLTSASRRYACCVYTEQALILSDVTTKLLMTWIIVVMIWIWSSLLPPTQMNESTVQSMTAFRYLLILNPILLHHQKKVLTLKNQIQKF